MLLLTFSWKILFFFSLYKIKRLLELASIKRDNIYHMSEIFLFIHNLFPFFQNFKNAWYFVGVFFVYILFNKVIKPILHQFYVSFVKVFRFSFVISFTYFIFSLRKINKQKKIQVSTETDQHSLVFICLHGTIWLSFHCHLMIICHYTQPLHIHLVQAFNN